MRRIIVGIAVLVLLWCGWWAYAAFGLRSGVASWFEDRRAEGWQAEVAELSVGGFPRRVSTTMEAISLADPAAGLAIGIDRLALSFRAIWPGDLRVDLPASPVSVATPAARWRLLADPARADLNLHPGTALELENLSLGSGPFRVEQQSGAGLFGGAGLLLALVQSPDAPNTYALQFDVTDFAPGEVPRQALLLPDDWPLIFDTLEALVQLTFDRPIDRTTLEDTRPQPQQVEIELIEAQWGEMRLFAVGQLVRDADGYGEGDLTIKAENWQQMLDLAETAGLLSAEFKPRIEAALNGLAGSTGSTNDLDVTLRFKGGLTRLGFLPLGPAPSLIVR